MSENLSSAFGQLRNAIRFHRNAADEGRKDDSFRLDRHQVSEYFGIHPKLKEKMREHFRTLRAAGKEVVHVDICGRATGESLGTDKSYCFSLKVSDLRKIVSGKENIFFDGDIFSTKDFNNFIKRLRNDGAIPSLVTFEPVAGLQSYDSCLGKDTSSKYTEVTYGQLERRLKEIFQVLMPGGYIYLARPFQSDGVVDFLFRKEANQYELSLQLKRICQELRCGIEIISEMGGPYYLIRKHLNAKKK